MTRLILIPLAVALAGCSGGSSGKPVRIPGYEIVVKSAKIKPTKKDGSKWDVASGKPDPFVRVSVMEGDRLTRTGQTKVVKSTVTPTWNDETVLTVQPGDWVVFHVKDKDVQFDDTIGLCVRDITREVEEKGELRLSFDQVEELVVVVRKYPDSDPPAPPPPPPPPPIPPGPVSGNDSPDSNNHTALAGEASARVRLPDGPRRAANAEQLRLAQQAENRLVQQLTDLNNQFNVAEGNMAGLRLAYDRAEPGSYRAATAEGQYLQALRAQRELQKKIDGAEIELRNVRIQISLLRS